MVNKFCDTYETIMIVYLLKKNQKLIYVLIYPIHLLCVWMFFHRQTLGTSNSHWAIFLSMYPSSYNPTTPRFRYNAPHHWSRPSSLSISPSLLLNRPFPHRPLLDLTLLICPPKRSITHFSLSWCLHLNPLV